LGNEVRPNADVIVLGAGVVGLACAWAARRDGFAVTIIDQDFDGDRASHGNAGGIGVTESTPITMPNPWKLLQMLANQLGPLRVRPAQFFKSFPWFWSLMLASRPHVVRASAEALASLNMRVYDDFLPMLDDIGARQWLYRRGALIVFESDTSFRAACPVWTQRAELGVKFERLDCNDIRELEPSLAPVFPRGLFLPDWSHVADPKRIVDAMCSKVAQMGVKLEQGYIAHVAPRGPRNVEVALADGRSLRANRVIVAMGAWSGRIANQLGDRVLLESERGYNTTVDAGSVSLFREVIFNDRSFVATPLDIGIRIGGGAEFAGLTAAPNYKRCDALLTLGQRFLPGLGDKNARRWMGHRPSTPDGLPVIGPSASNDAIVYAFGHGHLGLTHAATTGRLVTGILRGTAPTIPLAPFSVKRF
jgi:D-amino-acid dehydrogenase